MKTTTNHGAPVPADAVYYGPMPCCGQVHGGWEQPCPNGGSSPVPAEGGGGTGTSWLALYDEVVAAYPEARVLSTLQGAVRALIADHARLRDARASLPSEGATRAEGEAVTEDDVRRALAFTRGRPFEAFADMTDERIRYSAECCRLRAALADFRRRRLSRASERVAEGERELAAMIAAVEHHHDRADRAEARVAALEGEREKLVALADAAWALYDAAQIDGPVWTFRYELDGAEQSRFFRLVNEWGRSRQAAQEPTHSSSSTSTPVDR